MTAKIERDSNGCAQLTFECDDRNGFEFRVYRAQDGDLHLSVVPTREKAEETDGLYGACFSASVRLRMPMIGGGAHEVLYDAIVGAFNEELERAKT